jgi:hypothetical protein
MMQMTLKERKTHVEEFLPLRRSQKQHFSSKLTMKRETKARPETIRSYPILS